MPDANETDEDREYLEHMQKQREEAAAFIADPNVETPGHDDSNG